MVHTRGLWTLSEFFGLAKSFKSLACLAQAAQLRVFACEQARKHGGGFARWAADLRNLIMAPEQFGPKKVSGDWFNRSFLLCIDDNKQKLA